MATTSPCWRHSAKWGQSGVVKAPWVPWGVLDIAGVTGVEPEALTRRNFVPVILGLSATTVVAIILM